MKKLAILGGKPVLSEPLPSYCAVGNEENIAVNRVMQSGNLSGFYGSWGKQFFGGPEVNRFEKLWCELFAVKHAISMNSATSGLIAAMGAVGIEPGDEVIVPPYTMSATVIAPLMYGGIPIFVDVEPNTFCLDVEKVAQAITRKTKAIIAVNLFGHPAELRKLRGLAEQHHLKLIEDNAQAITAKEHGIYAGTIGHIGIFSLNYHKHIHSGEGGVCLTNDDALAARLQLIRNHGENVVQELQIENISGLLGANYRMTELCAAVGLAQLKRVTQHVGVRVNAANKILTGLADLAGITLPTIRADCSHAFYLLALRIDQKKLGISRKVFSEALQAEGVPNFVGYVAPLYRLPLFQKRIAFGHYPFNLTEVRYEKVYCPITEALHTEELLCFENCMYDLNDHNIEKIITAFQKVYEQRTQLKALQRDENVGETTYSSQH